MSVGNSNSVAISVGNKKTIPTEMPTKLQTDQRAKKKIPATKLPMEYFRL
jgi:hypothetical protein